MTYSKQRLREVTALKRLAVRRIKRDICQIDGSPSRKYIQDFNREFQNFESVCEASEIQNEAAQANLIWIGDYHALLRSQLYVSEFLRNLAARDRRIAVAVEPAFARNQKVL